MKKLLIILIILGVGGYFGYPHYRAYSLKSKGLLIESDQSIDFSAAKNYDDVAQKLEDEGIVESGDDFLFLAKYKKYASADVELGTVTIAASWADLNTLLNKINYEIGHYQRIAKVVISNVRTVEDIAGKVAKAIDADSSALSAVFNNDSIINHYGFTKTTFSTFFLPNTYECYSDITPEEFIQKMAKEYKKFWNAERVQKANDLGMTQSEVTILASIVYEEQKVKFDEQDEIAGLYINRLKSGWKLEADPTVKFAWGDPTIKRLLYKHLEIESPYNTYKYAGLPPGPISIPEPRTIDAVLDYSRHEYFFMCAKPEYSGYHNFSKTLNQHNIYAKEYQKWLNQQGIK